LRRAAGSQAAAPRVFVDSTRPGGVVGEMMAEMSGAFLECGSIGLKLCRVADGSADVFVKELVFKVWDVAPAALILEESGARVGLWSGAAIPVAGAQVSFRNLLAAPNDTFDSFVAALARRQPIPSAR
jgi:3'(2'), 5'-bisphosphate nucleotidase